MSASGRVKITYRLGWGAQLIYLGWGLKMSTKVSTLQQRIAALTSTTANLVGQLRELDRLRDRVWKAELAARRSRRIDRQQSPRRDKDRP
jgi:hypothetical protein